MTCFGLSEKCWINETKDEERQTKYKTSFSGTDLTVWVGKGEEKGADDVNKKILNSVADCDGVFFILLLQV